MCVSQSLNHLRIEARTDGLLEIGSDKTHFWDQSRDLLQYLCLGEQYGDTFA